MFFVLFSFFVCFFTQAIQPSDGTSKDQVHQTQDIQLCVFYYPHRMPPTLGIFLRLRLYGSPDRQGVSSGLLGVDGGLIRYEDAMLPSLVLFGTSSSLKLRRSEVCRKKAGLEDS